jgi:predicted RNA binding protein YcfA (HicA-like mRNA interferase family)
LLARAKAKPASLRFTEICALAECHGFQFARQRGTSHRIYKRPGDMQLMTFQEGANGMAITYQVRQLVAAIEDVAEREET